MSIGSTYRLSHNIIVAALISFTLLTTPVIVAQAQGMAGGSRDIPPSTPGSYGSDANGATSGNTLSSSTGENPVDSRSTLSGDTQR